MLNRDEKLIDIIWSPSREDEFAAYDNDLYLFKVTNFKQQQQTTKNVISLCDESNAELLATYGENTNPRIVAWNPSNSNPYMFAINCPNHKIQLINFNLSKKKTLNGTNKIVDIQKEFSFNAKVRQCKNMVWNPHKPNYLAAGFEKIRNEHSILIWDVRATANDPSIKLEHNTETIIYATTFNSAVKTTQYNPSTLASITTSMNSGSSSSAVYATINNIGQVNETKFEPKYETGTGETCNSLSWNPHEENSILAGMNGKYLKVYDTRAKNIASVSINTKYVNSFMMDPAPNSAPYQAASFNEKTVAIWDMRRFDRPLDTIVEKDTIIKMQWSPTKCGKLSTLAKNSTSFNIYSIKINNSSDTQSVIDDDNAPKEIIIDKTSKRPVLPSCSPNQSLVNTTLTHAASTKPNYFISNFCWSKFDSNKLMYATNFALSNLRTLCLSDTIVITWSPNADLCWSSNLGKINIIENFDKCEFESISELKDRNEFNYGLKYEIISIANGNATSQHSTAVTLSNSLAGTVGGSNSVIPLSLALNASHGISTLIRSDFMHNFKYCSLKTDRNSELINNVKFLWNWFDAINRFFEITIPLNPRNTQIELPANSRNILIELYWFRYCGLNTLLEDFISKRPETPELQQSHDDRFRVITLYLCGWDMKDGSVSRQFFTNLENRNQFERAACLAVLTNNYDQALDILENASKNDNRYGCIWIAVKYFYAEQQAKNDQQSKPDLMKQFSTSSSNSYSYSSSKFTSPVLSTQTSLSPTGKSPASYSSSLGHRDSAFPASDILIDECSKIIENFSNPYLKALFNYVLNKKEALFKILYDRNILLQDRIALSVCFIYNRDNQSQLQEYFDYIIEKECVGNLHGILLTGLNEKCIDLFQNFIDKTGDVQTVVMAIIHTPYIEILESKQVQSWIESYREILNKFKLWEKRAEFDILQMKLVKSRTTMNMSTSHSQLDPSTPPPLSSTFSKSVTPKHQSYPNGNQYLQHFNHLYTRQNFGQLSNQLISQRHNSFSQNLNIHLACNKCRKNLIDKPVLPLENRNTTFTSYQRSHANTISSNLTGNIFGTSNHLSNNLSNSNHYYQPGLQGPIKSFTFNGYKLNDSNINGCLNCAKYLPQCVICLKFQNINLIPSATALNQTQVNRPPPQLIIPLNRSQSLYDPSAKICLPMNSTGSTSKINYDHKMNALISPPMPIIHQTPNGVQFTNGGLYLPNSNGSNNNNNNNNLNAEQESNEEPLTEVKTPQNVKDAIQAENALFLDTNKFGKWFSWCQTCKHGGHIKHLIEWFRDHVKCPFMHCKCQCLTLDK